MVVSNEVKCRGEFAPDEMRPTKARIVYGDSCLDSQTGQTKDGWVVKVEQGEHILALNCCVSVFGANNLHHIDESEMR